MCRIETHRGGSTPSASIRTSYIRITLTHNPTHSLGQATPMARSSRPRSNRSRRSKNSNRSTPVQESAEDTLETEGKIVSVLAGTMFRVELDNQHQVLAHISGRMRKRFIRLANGDRVKLEMSPYDLSKARIVYRLG